MESLSFWTTGQNFTNLARDIWEEPNVKTSYELLEGLDDKMRFEILSGKKRLEGDTRKDPSLEVIEDNYSGKSVSKIKKILEEKYVETMNKALLCKQRIDYLLNSPLKKIYCEKEDFIEEFQFNYQQDESRKITLENTALRIRQDLDILYKFLKKNNYSELEKKIVGNPEDLFYIVNYAKQIEEKLKVKREEIKAEKKIEREEKKREVFEKTKRKKFLREIVVPVDPYTSNSYDGYFMPNGDFYETYREGHHSLEEDLIEKGVLSIEIKHFDKSYTDFGLVKLSNLQLLGDIYVDIRSHRSEDVSIITLEQRDSIVQYILGRKENANVFIGSFSSDYRYDQEGLVSALLKLNCKPYVEKEKEKTLKEKFLEKYTK